MNKYLQFYKGKSRFTMWILIFSTLLITVPILLSTNYRITAKMIGILTVVTLSYALWFWKNQTIRKINRKSRIRINLNDKFWLNEHIPFYRNLSKKDKVIFEDRIGLFLAEIAISEVDKKVPDKSTCFYVACSAVITFWGLPYWNYGELTEVIIYPENFNQQNEIIKHGMIQGKIHQGGLMDSTMILSLPALISGFSVLDGQNVGIHEFSHLLDKQDNEIDGLPFMFDEGNRKVWTQFVEIELKKKDHPSKIDKYAFTNDEEFFAVVMETYRELPNRLNKKYPELYQILDSYLNNRNN